MPIARAGARYDILKALESLIAAHGLSAPCLGDVEMTLSA